MELADHHREPSLQKLRRSVTSNEFLLWIAFIERKKLEREKLDYYLAQIAFEVHRCAAKDPNSIQFERFLMNFKMKDDRVEAEQRSEFLEQDVAQQRMSYSKAAWCALAGVQKPQDPNAPQSDKVVS